MLRSETLAAKMDTKSAAASVLIILKVTTLSREVGLRQPLLNDQDQSMVGEDEQIAEELGSVMEFRI